MIFPPYISRRGCPLLWVELCALLPAQSAICTFPEPSQPVFTSSFPTTQAVLWMQVDSPALPVGPQGWFLDCNPPAGDLEAGPSCGRLWALAWSLPLVCLLYPLPSQPGYHPKKLNYTPSLP
uniref:Uncharacterized protein n=1 Tax=Myotis myotis TaxID=51298 RepID=A0A7J7SC90_MYOMY|nr:hypothetical protein mMyoMyo1_009525 [Myotis myotis]